MERLDYLKKYRNDVKKISIDYVDSFITDEWKAVFKEKIQSKRIQNVIDIWKKHSEKELKNTISYLSEHLLDVCLVKTSIGISVIYELVMMDGCVDYYEGLLPISDYKKEFGKWENVPESLKEFYSFVHNGFYFYASQNMGILPIQRVTCMDDYDWGIIEDLDLEVLFGMNSTYIFFETGMGGYVLLDTQNCGDENSVVWFSKSKPMYDKNFWDIVDEWIVIGFN